MNEWFKKNVETIKEKWGKWTIVQKGILIGIVVVIIAGIVILATFSSKPTTVRLFNKAITDETERDHSHNSYDHNSGYQEHSSIHDDHIRMKRPAMVRRPFQVYSEAILLRTY